jgi:hypothetical protein
MAAFLRLLLAAATVAVATAQFACPIGQAYDSGSCVACPSGCSCPGGRFPALYCNSCPAGKYLSDTSSYTTGGGSYLSCNTCPSGCTCPGGRDPPVCNCAAGRWNTPDGCASCPSNGCTCAGGSAMPVCTSAPNFCSQGWVFNATLNTCTRCPRTPVSACFGGSSRIYNISVVCGPNEYLVRYGAQCVPKRTTCPGGSYLVDGICYSCEDMDANHNFACPGGTAGFVQCPTGQHADDDFTTCVNDVTTCPPGFYIYNGYCRKCSLGSACPGGTATQTYCQSPQEANSDNTACVAAPTTCPAGYFLNGNCYPCQFNTNPGGTTEDGYCPGGTLGPGTYVQCTSGQIPK